MAWTQADIEVIERAIASGTLSVKFADEEVVYRSISDLLKARDAMRSALEGSTGKIRCTYATYSKG